MKIPLTEHVDIQKLLTDVDYSYVDEMGLLIKKNSDVMIIKYDKKG